MHLDRFSHLLATLTISVASCLAGGCSTGPQADYSKLGLVEISGTVMLDGQALPKAAVFFVNEADRTHSYGATDERGHYTMMLNNQRSGVIPGIKRIEIATAKNPLGDSSGGLSEAKGGQEEDPDAAPKRSKNEKVPACYNDRSKLKVDITNSDAALDFNLKSDCSTTAAN